VYSSPSLAGLKSTSLPSFHSRSSSTLSFSLALLKRASSIIPSSRMAFSISGGSLERGSSSTIQRTFSLTPSRLFMLEGSEFQASRMLSNHSFVSTRGT
jgi:hypothetical protein